jgi:DNA-binding transcriptional LysR family regulator
MPDVRQRILVPKLLEYLRTAAPSVRIDLVYQSEVTGRLVETREVDLANGLLAQLEAGYFQKLFNDRFVCIVNRQRPRLCRGSITLEQFQSEWHSSVATQGTVISSWSKRLNACELGEKWDFASHTFWALSQPLRAPSI